MEGVINTGAITSTKQLLLDTPIPVQTNHYKPVSHGQLIDITLESLDVCGFKLSKELYSSARDGQQANGKYHLEYGNDPDMGLMIAWQNSYDKKLSLKFGIGHHVFICENGLICADMGKFKSKHIGAIQEITPAKLKEYVCRAGDNFEQMIKEKLRMKEIEITKKTTAELLGRLFINEGIITSTQLNIIKGEIDKPTFNYEVPNTVWELMNYQTFALKTCSPTTWMERVSATHKFYVNEFDIK